MALSGHRGFASSSTWTFGPHIVAEVASALATWHEAPENGRPMHVVHRRRFATNVIIAPGPGKLIDFGCATRDGHEDEAGCVRGKASYTALRKQAQGVPLDGPLTSSAWHHPVRGSPLVVAVRGSKANSIRRIVEEKPAPPTYVRHDYPAILK